MHEHADIIYAAEKEVFFQKFVACRSVLVFRRPRLRY